MDPVSERLARKRRRKLALTYSVLAAAVMFQIGYAALRHEGMKLAVIMAVVTIAFNLITFRKKLFRR